MLKDSPGGSNASKKGMEILNWTLIAVVIIVVAIVLTKIFKAFKAGAGAAGDIAGGIIIQQQTGIIPARQQACRQVAVDCENSITRVPLVGTAIWITDDEMVNALNRLLSAEEAALTSTFFKQQSGDSLKSHFEGWLLVDSSRQKVKDIIRQNLS